MKRHIAQNVAWATRVKEAKKRTPEKMLYVYCILL